jgi:hypothetical protein
LLWVLYSDLCKMRLMRPLGTWGHDSCTMVDHRED